MNFLGIKNARFIDPNNIFVDLILETDEGDLPFTYSPYDNSPATFFVKDKLSSTYIDSYKITLEQAKEYLKNEISQKRWEESIKPIKIEKYNIDFPTDETSLINLNNEIDNLKTEIEYGKKTKDSIIKWKIYGNFF